ncbi:MAG: xanthine dehydrogenase molybdopterin binding subunit, partial [Pseudomonadota bacterium]
PIDVRRANYYGIASNNVTPYQQTVEDNILEPLTERLLATSRYRERRAEIAAFNTTSQVLKRGIAFTPVKFGISFNVNHFNQAGALVHVYTDGSVLVNHGGTEMGQGVNTKVAQVVAHELRIPLERVRCTATDTQKVANTSATAASTGADLNGKAAQDAARKIRARLDAFAAERGLADAPFCELVTAAYMARVQLWSDGFYATPGLHWDRTTLTGHPFYYYAWGAAVSEVLVDTLTGEHRLLRADLLHDVGASLNPALDIGQVEGAYIQGMGWLTMEELWWQPDDGSPAGQRHAGRLMTHAPSTYKIPTALDCPPQFNVALWDGRCGVDTVHRSKAVGEPPLLLGFSAFFAIRDAIAAAAGPGTVPPLRAPATPEAVLDALAALRVGTPLRHGDR